MRKINYECTCECKILIWAIFGVWVFAVLAFLWLCATISWVLAASALAVFLAFIEVMVIDIADFNSKQKRKLK